jgi:small subunit ribosomal protein S17
MNNKKQEARNIGLNVKPPNKTCSDRNCPYHGSLPVRGQIINGIVSSVKMNNSILVKKEFTHLVTKYERYEKRTSTFAAHCPPCMDINIGDKIRIAECRPLSKTVSFVAIEKL